MEIIKIVTDDRMDNNTYLFCKSEKSVLFDCSVSYKTLEYEYKKKFKGQPLLIDAIFLTHVHFDHITYLLDVASATHAKIYIKSNSVELLIKNAKMIEKNDEKLQKIRNLNFVEIEDGYTFVFGEHIVKAIYTPGHTSCSMCYLLNDYLISGDTLFFGTIGRTDLETSSESDMKSSLQKLSLQNYTIGLPGHGMNFNKDDAISIINYYT